MRPSTTFNARINSDHGHGNRETNPFEICGLPTGDGMKYYVWITVVVAIIGLGCGGYAAYEIDRIHKFKGTEQDRRLRYLFLSVLAVNACTFSLATLLLVFGVLNENSRLCYAWIIVMIVLGSLWIFVLLYAIFTGASLTVTVFAVTIFEVYPGYGIWITFHYAGWAKRKQEHERQLHGRPSNVLVIRRSHVSHTTSHPGLPHEQHSHPQIDHHSVHNNHGHGPVKISDHTVH